MDDLGGILIGGPALDDQLDGEGRLARERNGIMGEGEEGE